MCNTGRHGKEKGTDGDGSPRAALANTHFATSRTLACALPLMAGHRLGSHGAALAQECRLRLKRPPPKAAPWFPPFKSSTPDKLRGSCASASSAPWQTVQVSVWKEKLRSGLIFTPKRNPKDFGRKGEDQGEHGAISKLRVPNKKTTLSGSINS